MKCVFFGSPDFGAASLAALLASEHQVLGVVTQPDRPSGRGLKLDAPAVKKLALQHNIPVFQPEKLNREETYAWLEKLRPEILVVVAYGEFLGDRLLKFCATPPVNVHPSLLPDLRGAAPMQWAVLRGYKTTGVSTQFMAKEMDAGDILLQKSASIGNEETAGELQERLKLVGGELLVETLTQIERKTISPRPQDSSKATLAPLLTKEQGLVHWHLNDAQKIHDQLRGLHPWPGAYSLLHGARVKLLRSRMPSAPVFRESTLQPGEFYSSVDSIFVRCKDSCLEITELQPEGKRPMLPREWVNGMQGSEIFRFDGV